MNVEGIMVDQEQNSVPVIAVTAAVGAVVLLLMLLFGIGKKDNKSENDQGKFPKNGIRNDVITLPI